MSRERSYEDEAEFVLSERLRRLRPALSNEEVVRQWWDLRTNPDLPNHFRRSTQRVYSRQIGYFLDFLKHAGPNSSCLHIYFVRADDIARYAIHLTKRGVGNGLRSYLNVLSSLYDYLVEVKVLVPSNPVTGAINHLNVVPVVVRAPKRSLSPSEGQRMFGAAKNMEHFFVNAFLAKTGVREEEFTLIQEEDVDFSEHRIHVELHPPKRHVDAVFMDDELEFVLERWLDFKERHSYHRQFLYSTRSSRGPPVNVTTVQGAVIQTAARAGLVTDVGENITPHTWRHTFTKWLRRAGCEPDMVAELRGDKRQSRSELTPQPMQENYNSIPWREAREAYLRHMPRVGLVRLLDTHARRVAPIAEYPLMAPLRTY